MYTIFFLFLYIYFFTLTSIQRSISYFFLCAFQNEKRNTFCGWICWWFHCIKFNLKTLILIYSWKIILSPSFLLKRTKKLTLIGSEKGDTTALSTVQLTNDVKRKLCVFFEEILEWLFQLVNTLLAGKIESF